MTQHCGIFAGRASGLVSSLRPGVVSRRLALGPHRRGSRIPAAYHTLICGRGP